MREPYSLLRRAWLPVALENGRRVFVRPCDIASPFDGQSIVRVDTGRPDCDVRSTEFLIGLLALAIGPKDRREWLAHYREAPTCTELQGAFERFELALMLDGDGPRFFQDLEEIKGRRWPVDNLFGDAPGDNALKENGDHFIKRRRYSTLSRAGAAISLLALQTIAPSGGAGQYTALRGPGPLTTTVVPGTQNTGGPHLGNVSGQTFCLDFAAPLERIKRVFPWTEPTRTATAAGITTPNDVHVAHCFFGMPRRIRLIFTENKDAANCDLLGLIDDIVVPGFDMKAGGTNYEAWGKYHPLSPHWRKSGKSNFDLCRFARRELATDNGLAWLQDQPTNSTYRPA